ncbi:uncharacterized protein [Arachis hypogaea]|uniref:very-long-chain (3R)-3-hydroxyacyl-CoA dehydratase n=1 Tax=Arachis hypogaea TaxID=3818 RepID=A0A444Y6H2_ARAHY|nr:ATP-dependent 6-phosphofructokinase [Arachis hypogaea]RYQ97561.1 hypothetical protein Ahy_B08g093640 isoform C [Arachis hypogaea]
MQFSFSAMCCILGSYTWSHWWVLLYTQKSKSHSLQPISFYQHLHCNAQIKLCNFSGLVPSGALLPLMQWGGRTHFLLAIVTKLDEVQKLPSVFITFFAWSISEVIRYSHYAFSCIGNCPYWITYLRYTAFIVLYPLGVGPGEIWIMYRALPIVKKKNLYSETFSGLPFSYYNFLKVYIIGGDGTQRGASRIFEEVRRRGLKVAVVGIPKTIDNDIPVIDKSFGFDTAVEEAQRAINATHVEAESIENGIGVVKLMGRYSGFISMYATLASRDVDCCLIPESPFYLEGPGGLLEFVERRLKENGHMVGGSSDRYTLFCHR